jgi:phenylalanyl-tRNA synthetase beta subunit
MQDTARTLTDPEIDAIIAELLGVLAEKFRATLRQ